MTNLIKNIYFYFFEALPGTNFNFYIPSVILLLILVAASIYLKVYLKSAEKNYKKLFRDTPAKLLNVSFFLGLYLFFRSTNVYLLSMRFWMYLIFAYLIYLAYNHFKKFNQDLPALNKLAESRKNQRLSKKKK